MLTIALSILLGGALAGGFLALRHFTKKPLPMAVALIHGAFGATALVVLLLEVLARPTFSTAGYALIILVCAAGLGFLNFSFHLRKRPHRSTLIVLHALVAVTGAGTLLYAVLGH